MIPKRAHSLLDFIGDIEAPKGYDTIYGNNQHRLRRGPTKMTVDQVIAAQRRWTKAYGSSAAGRYQFMRATLRSLKKQGLVKGNELFTPEVQNRLAYELLKKRGYRSFCDGRMTIAAFGKNLAREWASLPVLLDTAGAHQKVKRGQSYYAGDKLNKSLVHPERVEKILMEVRGNNTTKPPKKMATQSKRSKPVSLTPWQKFVKWFKTT